MVWNYVSIVIGGDETAIEVKTRIGAAITTIPTIIDVIARIAHPIVYRMRIYTQRTAISLTTREMIQRTRGIVMIVVGMIATAITLATNVS